MQNYSRRDENLLKSLNFKIMGKKEKEMYEFTPRYSQKPYCCPVCNGKGKVPSTFYDLKIKGEVSETKPVVISENCKGCVGGGIVWG